MFKENIQKTVGQTYGLRSIKGEFGIEIETEGHNLQHGQVTRTFVGKEDGSLRHGIEYVSKPIQRKEIIETVTNLKGEVIRLGGQINPSYRSSTHIHQNFIDNKWCDVLGAVVTWTILEPSVLRVMPRDRDGSIFCLSSYDTGDASRAMSQLCDDLHTWSWRHQYRGKYSSQNLLRLNDLGTIEYRVFPSSMDGQQIDEWAGWLEAIKTTAVKQEDKSFLGLVEHAEKNPIVFVGDHLGPKYVREDTAQLVDFGVRHAYELARVIHEYTKKDKPAEKKFLKKSIPGLGGAEIGAAILDDIAEVDAAPVNRVDFARAEEALRRAAIGGDNLWVNFNVQAQEAPQAPQPVPPIPQPDPRDVAAIRRLERNRADEAALGHYRLDLVRRQERVRNIQARVDRGEAGLGASLRRAQHRVALLQDTIRIVEARIARRNAEA